jgi:hypothetical protein
MSRKGLIHFRCWYCNRKLVAGWDQVGERRVCNCGERYRVPRSPGMAQRDRSFVDWVAGFVVYGFGGGFLGMALGLLSLRFAPFHPYYEARIGATLLVLGGVTVLGFVVGGLFGESGINWIGSYIRRIEDE